MIYCTLTRKSEKNPEEFENKAGERTTMDSLLQNEGDRVRGKVGQTGRRRGICTQLRRLTSLCLCLKLKLEICSRID
jgi:hypothetical protein